MFGSIAGLAFFQSRGGLTVAPAITLGPEATNLELGSIVDSPITRNVDLKPKPCRIQRRGRARGRRSSSGSVPNNRSSETKISVRRNNESPSSSVATSRQKKKKLPFTQSAKINLIMTIPNKKQISQD
ncbi:hypothetical protein DSO57_1007786 [Entomophthora muscae]|uniref:Uncharacterized protein n=1 Tax=Entomophthora muscae TaxID=34485 RepID=A0ACC2RMA3_9FUNG|nr:hypothetical protein DSO57_1007786 [Entomophthora muscae]